MYSYHKYKFWFTIQYPFHCWGLKTFRENEFLHPWYPTSGRGGWGSSCRGGPKLLSHLTRHAQRVIGQIILPHTCRGGKRYGKIIVLQYSTIQYNFFVPMVPCMCVCVYIVLMMVFLFVWGLREEGRVEHEVCAHVCVCACVCVRSIFFSIVVDS